jgi:hypothetical protein
MDYFATGPKDTFRPDPSGWIIVLFEIGDCYPRRTSRYAQLGV